MLPLLDPIARFLGIEIPFLRDIRRTWNALSVGFPLFSLGMLFLGFGVRVLIGKVAGDFRRWPYLVVSLSAGGGLAVALAGWLVVVAAPFLFLHTTALMLGAIAFLLGNWLAGVRWTGTRL